HQQSVDSGCDPVSVDEKKRIAASSQSPAASPDKDCWLYWLLATGCLATGCYMDIPFELHIALRYLLAKRKQAFISVISLISTLGVVVGVMALVIALALMTGLQAELRNRILGSNAHVYVWKQGGIVDYHAETRKLLQLPHVVGAAPA